jgi:tetratricopeptide (TPR) repeat protein
LFEAERFEEAEAVLREAMDLEPMAPEAYSRLGEVLVNRGRERWADAEEALRFAMSLEPERGVHRARLGRLLRVRAMVSEDSAAAATLREEAKELLEAAIKESSRYGWPFLELTYLLLDMDGDMDRAEWCLHKAHKIFEGKHPGLSLALARVMARTRREEEAEQRIQRALKGKSNPHEAHFALGELYYSMGKVFAAASEFETAINFAPEGIPERELYKLRAAQTTLLITSGQAVEIEKAAEVERAERALQQAAQAAGEVKHQSDRGNTVVRRKGSGRGGERAAGGEARGGGRGRGGRGQQAQAAQGGEAAGGEAAGAEAPSDITPDEAGDEANDGVGEALPSSDEIPMDGDPSAE